MSSVNPLEATGAEDVEAAAGSAEAAGSADGVRELVLRPRVGMQQYASVPHVVALGVCDALSDRAIAWPHGIADAETGELVCSLEAHAGYDDEGMFARVSMPGELLTDSVEAAIRVRVDAWAAALSGRPRLAPLAPVLSDYAERLALLGRQVRVTYPNGAAYATGEFCGIDVWGRATVRLANGTNLEFPPERYNISP